MIRNFPHEVKSGFRKILWSFGWNISRYNVHSSEWMCIVRMLVTHKVSVVLDVGANEGQYAQALRQHGFAGRIVSFEPVRSAHRKLEAVAKGDSLWVVPPPVAIGNDQGSIKINVSKNGVSSSVLPI